MATSAVSFNSNFYLIKFSLLLVTSHFCVTEAQSSVPIVKGLSWSFYDSSCPKLESIVRKQLQKVFKKDIGQAAGLLRLHFHDCFVKGCEGSVLLDGSSSGPSEQDAPPNLTLRPEAFKIIDDLRRRVHKQCGRVVSCSDITALAARDAVFLSGGPDYDVPLGRRDALDFASRNATLANLPAPTSNTSALLTSLATKNLDATDVVALSGGHTIGVGHCDSFTGRLYPTQGSTMDKTFATNLKVVCPTATTNATTVLDIRSPNVFDNKYYVDLMNRQGLFTSDQDLYTDRRTRGIVTSFAVNQTLFFEKFVDAMMKMGQLNVLTGTQGEIRANCSVRNSNGAFLASDVNEPEEKWSKDTKGGSLFALCILCSSGQLHGQKQIHSMASALYKYGFFGVALDNKSKTMASSASLLLVITALLISTSSVSVRGVPTSAHVVKGLSWTFHESTCPKLESIVRNQLKKIFKEDIGQAAGLLRLHFHDCFVQGCDGSVLLDGSHSGPSEKDAPPNLTLRARAFKIIDDLRRRVHEECGRVVSCADIVALAARDAVFLSGGPNYDVPLGRKDGLNFATRDATLANLPSPTSNASAILASLATKNLDATDVVALSGGHTIGIGHCSSFTPRLYPSQDPTMDKTFANELKHICSPPPPDSNNTTLLDIRTPNTFDNKYYVDLMNRQGLFTSDQDLYTDAKTRDIVESFAIDQALFFDKFVHAMIKMGQLSVLIGGHGEIRSNCSVRNSDNTNSDNTSFSTYMAEGDEESRSELR
ncbi:hypothetical protein RJ640_020136 [Escallonia rubra]|uniref:peroxidase n=1 Tax=Escallonia rubra TaxID=112253 RepID=A0AA88U641_9ASTE|nr:hypothetical protein RJ640_020136 [Escallonia rubra]